MDFLTGTLESIGCEVERVEYKDPAGVLKVNLIGRKGPENGERGLALLGHIDTVPLLSVGRWIRLRRGLLMTECTAEAVAI